MKVKDPSADDKERYPSVEERICFLTIEAIIYF
jgi:hypothetical protein